MPTTVTQTINSNTTILITTTQAIGSNTGIFLNPSQTISSDTEIQINRVQLQLFKESDLTTEVGTEAIPVTFGTVVAGTTVLHPDNPFVLFNDKGGVVQSVDARHVKASVVQMTMNDELLAVSNGAASQSYTVAFPPIVDDGTTVVKVNNITWTRVNSFAGSNPTDEVYVLNASVGTVTFGDDLQGKIPPNGNNITITYTPDTLLFGKEIADQLWLGVQSNGIISNPVSVPLEHTTPLSVTSVPVRRTPINSVNGVFLFSDPHKIGTNFFTGGTFDSLSGILTLGTPLPSATDVWVDYVYEIADDAEGGFIQVNRTTKHEFASAIPSNNAKRLNFQLVVPSLASPSGGGTVKFRIRFEYQE